jgi:hypothetical protein
MSGISRSSAVFYILKTLTQSQDQTVNPTINSTGAEMTKQSTVNPLLGCLHFPQNRSENNLWHN